MKITKRLLSLSLAAVMSMGLGLNAFADNQINVPGDTADIPITISGEAYSFSVTVPTSFPIVIDKFGKVVAASTAKIVNNSAAGVAVTELRITPAPGYELVTYGKTEFSGEAPEKYIGMSFAPNGGTPVQTADGTEMQSLIPQSLLSQWKMGAKGSDNDALELAYAATLPIMAEGADNVTAANVVFVLSWAQ